jgi:hypothetical protein
MKVSILITIVFFQVSFLPKEKCPLQRVYAFSQAVLPGVPPNGPVEEGQSEPGKSVRTSRENYLIYIVPRKNNFINPSVLWINGQGYEVKADTITRLPVKIKGSDEKEMVLVPSISKTVIQLTPGHQLNFFAPPEPHLQKLLDKNELVIEYMWKETICYFSVEKLKKLEAVAAP